MSGIPIFPAGVVNIYESPTKFSKTFDLKNFPTHKHQGSNKWRSEKLNNVLLHESLTELHDWVKTCIDDYLERCAVATLLCLKFGRPPNYCGSIVPLISQ